MDIHIVLGIRPGRHGQSRIVCVGRIKLDRPRFIYWLFWGLMASSPLSVFMKFASYFLLDWNRRWSILKNHILD
ncbi:hypothetical protein BDV38DRAFT_232157 [Aspergillus pseudotamarii]|uniref:Transmembrane protein n=1 Tax=Aspergillus pseudotamarii TaxID=132259 RepID=A0A5N6TBX6_ASPPS|nr:uncharacterized protein BDV38DRAFT_232157 [Aspergillus pseudotamarii]KAE8143875.1 hypothetical protein BDV38DRAFT_232157 [Aspergillus pseudotamarii]